MGSSPSTAACDIVTHTVQHLTSTVMESKMPSVKMPCASLWFVVVLDMKKGHIVGQQSTAYNVKNVCKCHYTHLFVRFGMIYPIVMK